MTFLEALEDYTRRIHHAPLEEYHEEILTTFKLFGEYLNKIPSDGFGIIEGLEEVVFNYYIKKRDYEDFNRGNSSMMFESRDGKTTQGKQRANSDINVLKKTRNLLQHVSHKDYRIMQGDQQNNRQEEFIPKPPMEWQTKKNGTQKYKKIEDYSFINYQDKEIALKAYNQTIALYDESKKYPFAGEHRVEKDVFNTYWFLTALINDLEDKKFYLFEKSHYYKPEKPSKAELKKTLTFIRNAFNIKGSLEEKELTDNL